MTRFGFLSSYPPTRCGLATFTESLAAAVVRVGEADAHIVRVLDAPEPRPALLRSTRTEVVADLIADDQGSISAAVRALNACDIAVVQHEYGIYGGRDGEDVLAVLREIDIVCIVVLHTVLASPTRHQREVLEEVCRLATAVVVMTENARELLITRYTVIAEEVQVIPHGVPEPLVRVPRSARTSKRVLSWGLISPGKGIEWGIRAFAQLRDLAPGAEYLVAGQTHPKVLAHAGEAYRESLSALVDELGLAEAVTLDGRYLDPQQLAELVRTADVVLLPYDSRDQATSGVLIEAIAAGIPVVATAFPHAVELLSGGAGIVVPHEDPDAIARALRSVLTMPVTAERMRAAALRDSGEAAWPSVAERYLELYERLAAARAA